MNTKTSITLAIIGLFLALFCMASNAWSNEPAESAAKASESHEKSVEIVDRGIRYLLRKSPCWGLSTDSEKREQMARAIVASANKYDLPPLLLTVILKRESSFQPNVIGQSNGERGVGQVHGMAARGCDLSTLQGQTDCSARWLRKARNICGDWIGASTAYLSGRCKAPKRSKLHRNASSRVKQWKASREAVDRCARGALENNTGWLCEPPRSKCVARIREINRG